MERILSQSPRKRNLALQQLFENWYAIGLIPVNENVRPVGRETIFRCALIGHLFVRPLPEFSPIFQVGLGMKWTWERTMKKWIHIIWGAFFFANLSWAGDLFVDRRLEVYDPVSGYFIKGVKKLTERGLLKLDRVDYMNLALFNPVDGSIRTLFKSPLEGRVDWVVFEVANEKGEIRLHESLGRIQAYNLRALPARPVRNRIWVGTRSADSKTLSIYSFNRDGSAMQHLLTLTADSDWHIDWKASKLRIINQLDNTINVVSHDW
jgi:hypothetical protein